MALRSIILALKQEVCLVLSDTQGTRDKKHPTAPAAYTYQCKLVHARMAWKNAHPNCTKPCIHPKFSFLSKKYSQRCSAIQINKMRLEQVLLH